EALAYPYAKRRDGADPVLDLGEIAIVLGPGQRPLGEQIQLVRPVHPAIATFGESTLLPALDGVEDASRVFGIHRPAGVEVRELGDAYRHQRDAQHRLLERPEITQRLFEHVGIVEAWDDDDLAVELNAPGGESRELVDDVGDARIVEEDLPRFPRGRVHRDVERRQAVLQDPRDVALL